MHDLTERQRLVLAMVVKSYIEHPQPVSSKALVERYGINVSTATLRNEMSALTEMGYLRQPHTSAGRVPTEEGYRYFVRQLMVQSELPASIQRMIIHQFHQAKGDVEQWMRLAASVLATQSQAAALVTPPHPHQVLFKHLELIATSGRQVLMVLVLVGGEVRQQMLLLAESVSQARLSAAANSLNSLYQEMSAEAISARPIPSDPLEAEVTRLVVDEMKRSSKILAGEIYRDGLTNVLAEPEFAESSVARRALRIFEERPLLEDLISRTILASNVGSVHVLIGGEDTWEELRECSIILARYGAPDLITGTLGVIGPIRMPYGQTIPTVRFVAGVLSDLVTDTFVE